MSFEKQKEEMVRICHEIWEKGQAELILGFGVNEAAEFATPLFVRNKDDIGKLIWDGSCSPNLAKYVLAKKEKVAIVAKPCDIRALVMYMIEKQITRDQVIIIGMECPGMQNGDNELHPWCAECKVHVPPIYNYLIKSENLVEQKKMEEPQNSETSNANLEANLQRLQAELKKCIMCFSCRQACYGCYCTTCFMDRNIPNWQPNELDMGAKLNFHLGRFMHLAGRCVECGACERVCPSGVKIRYIIKDLTDFCEKVYGYQAGLDPNEVPVLTAFEQNDKEFGFLGGEKFGNIKGSKCCDKAVG
ncbi:4Fe-4S dicluster domain-containing protein [Bacillota bacterium LX-D]|nr:4Fe-4S dicluster domain-containing protein [Bacillota bacterium LX-D]